RLRLESFLLAILLTLLLDEIDIAVQCTRFYNRGILQALKLLLVGSAFFLLKRAIWQTRRKTIFLPFAKVSRNPRIAKSGVKIIHMLLFVLFLTPEMFPPEKRICVTAEAIC